MKSIYIIEWNDGIDMDGICCIFSTKELAEQFIEKCYAWKEDFKKKFGKSYDELYDSYKLKDKHMDWLWDNGIEYKNNYYIREMPLYDENDVQQAEQKMRDYTYRNIPED